MDIALQMILIALTVAGKGALIFLGLLAIAAGGALAFAYCLLRIDEADLELQSIDSWPDGPA